MLDDPYNDIVYSIVGAAYEVQKELHGGLSEAIYHEALCLELQNRDIKSESEAELIVYYKNKPLQKRYRVDILCADDIILELKAVDDLISEHRAQLYNYLRITRKPIGILINFSKSGVQIEKYKYDFLENNVDFYNIEFRKNVF